jgi:hypothetical protein
MRTLTTLLGGQNATTRNQQRAVTNSTIRSLRDWATTHQRVPHNVYYSACKLRTRERLAEALKLITRTARLHAQRDTLLTALCSAHCSHRTSEVRKRLQRDFALGGSIGRAGIVFGEDCARAVSIRLSYSPQALRSCVCLLRVVGAVSPPSCPSIAPPFMRRVPAFAPRPPRTHGAASPRRCVSRPPRTWPHHARDAPLPSAALTAPTRFPPRLFAQLLRNAHATTLAVAQSPPCRRSPPPCSPLHCARSLPASSAATKASVRGRGGGGGGVGVRPPVARGDVAAARWWHMYLQVSTHRRMRAGPRSGGARRSHPAPRDATPLLASPVVCC